MKRLMIVGLGLALALLIAPVLVLAQPPTPTPSPMPGPGMIDLGQFIPALKGIPLRDAFGHFRGAQYSFTDREGNPVTVNVIPGTVTAVSSDSITITPTGQTTTRSFGITTDTHILARPPRGSITAITAGDHVFVVTQDQSMDALFILKPMHFGMMGHFGMMKGMPSTETEGE